MERGNSTSVSDRSLRRKHSVDGICDLPDSILGHILSFLPTKNAVATHVLSQRWKFLWTNTSNLDFHYSKSGPHGNSRFVNFVNFVLLLHKPGCLNRFSLTWGTWCIPFHVNIWLSIAVARNVHELIVHASTSRLEIQVLRSMFSCEGLRSLELNCEICLSPEIVVSLPRLENLKLISVYFQSEEDFCKLLGGCPVLKYLYIDMDIGKMIRYLHLEIDDVVFEYMVSSTSLKRLEIYAHGGRSELEGTLLCSVFLDAPSLEYVKLDDLISSIFIQQERLTSLVEADIQLADLESIAEEQNLCNFIAKAFCAFDYARTLTLSAQVSRALSCATTKMRTMFNKLTRLEVKIDWNHWSSVQDFIELSDNLEVLTIHKDYGSGLHHYNDSNWKNPKVIPRCLSSSLKTVSMKAYDGHQDELEMIGYILKYGSVLQVLEIRFGESIVGFKTISEELQKILKFPRKSPVCEVEFRG